MLVWSSGYISGPYGVEHVAPFTLLALRFAVAAVLALVLARLVRGPLRIDRGTLGRVALTGIVMNAVQFGAMYLAFDAGLGATLASLLHALTPVLTAVLAALFLREALSRLQVVGLVIGVTGVLIVLGPDVAGGGRPGRDRARCVQRDHAQSRHARPAVDRARSGPDLVGSHPVHGVGATPRRTRPHARGHPCRQRPASAAASRSRSWRSSTRSSASLLLGALVRRGGAGAGSSLFFLSPPVTAVLAWIVLGETLGPLELLGLVVAVVGVALGTRRASPRLVT